MRYATTRIIPTGNIRPARLRDLTASLLLPVHKEAGHGRQWRINAAAKLRNYAVNQGDLPPGRNRFICRPGFNVFRKGSPLVHTSELG